MCNDAGQSFDNSQSLLANAPESYETMGTSCESTTTLIVANTPSQDQSDCFCAGTRIATPQGYVPVERFAAGDEVLTATGAAQRIVWIGSGRVLVPHGRRSSATPVIVRKGALADDIPSSDLYITKGHSLFIDGVLIPVEHLINHHSIVWDDQTRDVEIFHVELENHDVLLANGAPAESYRDDGTRWLFHGDTTSWDRPPRPACAPVLTGGEQVDEIWRRLRNRCRLPLDLPTTDAPDLHLLVDGHRVEGRLIRAHVYSFRLRQPPAGVRIASRADAPDELGFARDPRRLGVALRQILLWRGAHLSMIALDDERLSDGFHAYEADHAFRWTNGDALLPAELFADVPGACELELHVACTSRYALATPQTGIAGWAISLPDPYAAGAENASDQRPLTHSLNFKSLTNPSITFERVAASPRR
jgi:hypothetical protein